MRRTRIGIPALVRSARVYLSTPRAAKKLPPRLSGKKRKPFQFVTAMNQVREYWTKSRSDAKSLLATEAFGEYVSRVDDLFDQLNSPPAENRLFYKSDPEARKHITHFVKAVKGAPLTTEQRREIFKIAGNFRRYSFMKMGEYQKKPPTLENVIQEKEDTTGAYARMVVAVLNVASRVPKAEREKVEKAFFDAGMAIQVSDDLLDMHADRRAGVNNVVFSVLKEQPIELARAMRQKRLTPLWLRIHCPRTYSQIQSIMNTYLDRLPKGTASDRVFRAFPKIIWYVSQFNRS